MTDTFTDLLVSLAPVLLAGALAAFNIHVHVELIDRWFGGT